jgi:hypothetical protein
MQPAQDGARKKLLKDEVSALSEFILAIPAIAKTNSFPAHSTFGNQRQGPWNRNQKQQPRQPEPEPRATPSGSLSSKVSDVRHTTKPNNASMGRSGRIEGNRRHGQWAMED